MIDHGFFAAAIQRFDANGLPPEKTMFDISIAWRHYEKEPEFVGDKTLLVPMNAMDMVEDLPLEAFAGRQVWITYDHSDPLAKQKAADLAAMLRANRRARPALAAFMDRKDHLWHLTPASAGWKDVTPQAPRS